jgi:hypothetical protein
VLNTEPTEPTEPTLSADPTDPMLNTDPWEATLNRDPSDHRDHRDHFDSTTAHLRSKAHHHLMGGYANHCHRPRAILPGQHLWTADHRLRDGPGPSTAPDGPARATPRREVGSE